MIQVLPDGSKIEITEDKIVQCYYQYHDDKKLLAEFDHETCNTVIYPIVTRIASPGFLEAKYKVNFKLEGYDIDIEEREEPERLLLLSGLPKVFIKTLQKKKSSRKDVVYRFIKDIDFSKHVSDNDKKSLLEFKNAIELGYFAALKTEFDNIIKNKHEEAHFQKFFEKNPLLLTLFAGSPCVLFNNQAYLGGKSFDNKNGQYTDFLYKNKLTNNSFIIEIKRPDTSLLETKPYRRTGVYQPSKDLSGAVSQVLAQKYQLDSDIATLLKNTSDRNVDAYNTQCLLIVGLIKGLDGENVKEKKRSFELYRNNQKNIRIITYDECQELLNIFLDSLKRGTNS